MSAEKKATAQDVVVSTKGSGRTCLTFTVTDKDGNVIQRQTADVDDPALRAVLGEKAEGQ